MTKQEWKKQLVDLLMSEPETGKDRNKMLDRKELEGYIDQLETSSDSFYGIGWEIIVAIEIQLGV